MAETANIAKIAERLSDELFPEFFWTKIGPMNQNWSCEAQDHHGVKTHPSDVVFYYDEPYSDTRTYINCDLKSYSKSSITRAALKGAVESLAKQVACAEKSDEWHKLYIHDNVSPSICGLLFVYNHDGEYDQNFHAYLSAVKTESLDLPQGSKLVVLGPEDIFWLDNVRYEIRQLRGSSGPNRLPDSEHCRYFYPQLARKANIQFKAKAATLEMLTAPWIVLEYDKPKTDRKGVIVFYRRKGESPQEFMYLIDFLRHYQVLHEKVDVCIKTLDTVPTAHSQFQKAVDQYIEEISEGNSNNDLAALVRAIQYSKITQVLSTFSDIELGLDYDR